MDKDNEKVGMHYWRSDDYDNQRISKDRKWGQKEECKERNSDGEEPHSE